MKIGLDLADLHLRFPEAHQQAWVTANLWAEPRTIAGEATPTKSDASLLLPRRVADLARHRVPGDCCAAAGSSSR
jgi:hypothetical protein